MKQAYKKQFMQFRGEWIFTDKNLSKIYAHDKDLSRLSKKLKGSKTEGSITRVPLDAADAYVG
ncbi:hypothetical protein A2382_03300 [Candidatus Woesebacteria bacterium RIFOXYB1_FULL_38_16]|uniref:DUF5678 domain-containing protein n=1 Tax=Candidatus Woesebacteria bacterium RIFOXYB1_FULL_38_16 TaxID=1802538 RepID=A0A1F8CTZ1_9BACT|nr:MAG: hypothetical protein A2191_04155 [Candidatus Woesebacteria bacterium RIFOXYA1_FULL_38_9]OGM79751.1 MAG: hypothetical protein A2382_03300 [Candidatus Woesebacteria bacterium RIFOXYB1_FULL_38_16]